MPEITQPSRDHVEFDAMCAAVQDWEPLPDLAPARAQQITWVDAEGEEQTVLDGQILAGLVSPY
jgi:hypothetical protein